MNEHTRSKLNREVRSDKKKRSYVVCAVIAAMLTIAAAGCASSGKQPEQSPEQTAETALTIGEKDFAVSDVQFFYTTEISNLQSNSYFAYFDLDVSRSLKEQTMGEMAKYCLGVEEDQTWHDYVLKAAEENLTYLYATYAKAIDAGYTFDKELQKELDGILADLDTYAAMNGMAADEYLRQIYGGDVTVETMSEILKMDLVVQKYGNDFVNNTKFTDAELKAYVDENRNDYYLADYEYLYFRTTAADSAEDLAAAAREKANAVKTRCEAGESLEEIAKEYEDGTYYHVTEGVYGGSAADEWVRSAERKDGDVTVQETDAICYVVVYHDCSVADYNTADVRHILVAVDDDYLEPTSATYAEDLAAVEKIAKDKADELYAQWKADPTVEHFAQLANEQSDDMADGGLYTQVYHNQMVPEFNDWVFDPARKPGDTGMVKTSYGYHIMYYVGVNEKYWKIAATEDLLGKQYSDMMEEAVAALSVTEGPGIQKVG